MNNFSIRIGLLAYGCLVGWLWFFHDSGLKRLWLFWIIPITAILAIIGAFMPSKDDDSEKRS